MYQKRGFQLTLYPRSSTSSNRAFSYVWNFACSHSHALLSSVSFSLTQQVASPQNVLCSTPLHCSYFFCPHAYHWIETLFLSFWGKTFLVEKWPSSQQKNTLYKIRAISVMLNFSVLTVAFFKHMIEFLNGGNYLFHATLFD